MCHKQSRPKAENKFTFASITIIRSEPTHPEPRERTHPEEHPSCLPTKVRALPAPSSAPFWEMFETNIFIQSAWADDYRCLYTVMQSETSPTHPPRSLSSYPSCIPPIKCKVSPPAPCRPLTLDGDWLSGQVLTARAWRGSKTAKSPWRKRERERRRCPGDELKQTTGFKGANTRRPFEGLALWPADWQDLS